MKAKRQQIDRELMVIKLFSGNYARSSETISLIGEISLVFQNLMKYENVE
jgi:hypothetical protein